jgi:hypothetical protein
MVCWAEIGLRGSAPAVQRWVQSVRAVCEWWGGGDLRRALLGMQLLITTDTRPLRTVLSGSGSSLPPASAPSSASSETEVPNFALRALGLGDSSSLKALDALLFASSSFSSASAMSIQQSSVLTHSLTLDCPLIHLNYLLALTSQLASTLPPSAAVATPASASTSASASSTSSAAASSHSLLTALTPPSVHCCFASPALRVRTRRFTLKPSATLNTAQALQQYYALGCAIDACFNPFTLSSSGKKRGGGAGTGSKRGRKRKSGGGAGRGAEPVYVVEAILDRREVEIALPPAVGDGAQQPAPAEEGKGAEAAAPARKRVKRVVVSDEDSESPAAAPAPAPVLPPLPALPPPPSAPPPHELPLPPLPLPLPLPLPAAPLTRIEYRVKWAGYPLSAASWEPASNLSEAQEMLTEFERARSAASASAAASTTPSSTAPAPTSALAPAASTSAVAPAPGGQSAAAPIDLTKSESVAMEDAAPASAVAAPAPTAAAVDEIDAAADDEQPSAPLEMELHEIFDTPSATSASASDPSSALPLPPLPDSASATAVPQPTPPQPTSASASSASPPSAADRWEPSTLTPLSTAPARSHALAAQVMEQCWAVAEAVSDSDLWMQPQAGAYTVSG